MGIAWLINKKERILTLVSTNLEIIFNCKQCGGSLTLEEKDIKPKKIFGDEVNNAKIFLIKKAMQCGWLFEIRDCTCPSCRTDKGRN
jgi:hypothetical protein